MKVKQLAIVTGILGVLAIIVWFAERPASGDQSKDPRVGSSLLEDSMIKNLSQIKISGQGESIELQKGDSGWIVPSEYNLPVDFSRLSRMINSLRENTIKRFVTERSNRLERLDLDNRIIALSTGQDSESPDITFNLGRRSDAGGQYIQFAGSERAYLLEESVSVPVSSSSWIDKQLVFVSPEEIKTFKIEFSEANYSFEEISFSRNAPEEEFVISDSLKMDWSLRQERLNRWLDTLTNLRFTRYEPEDSPEVAEARPHFHEFFVETFDGQSIKIHLGRRPEMAKPQDGSQEGKPGTEGGTESSEPDTIPAGPVIALLDISGKSDKPREPYQELAFVVSDYVANQIPGWDELFSKKQQEPESNGAETSDSNSSSD